MDNSKIDFKLNNNMKYFNKLFNRKKLEVEEEEMSWQRGGGGYYAPSN